MLLYSGHDSKVRFQSWGAAPPLPLHFDALAHRQESTLESLNFNSLCNSQRVVYLYTEITYRDLYFDASPGGRSAAG